MSFRRVGWLAALALATLLEMSCGQVYRPVVIPVAITPPNPANFHEVFGISTNVPFNQGTALQIDVSGDSDIGVSNMGVNPMHATILPNFSRVFVASAGSIYQNTTDADVVMAFTPAADSQNATGLGNATTFSLPYGSLPVFVNTTQNNAIYVANYGTNTVSSLNTAANIVNLTAPVGNGPVALAETADALNLYVLNQGDNTVMDLAPVDLTPLATIPVGNNPVWEVARVDSRRLYVLTQGSGQLLPIDTVTNTVLPSETNLSVGVGADFILYDSNLNRLYVTNPTTGMVYVFSTTGGLDPSTGTANDTPTLLATISMTAGANPPCPAGSACSPVSVAALPDGSRFYVASYQYAGACPDPVVGASPCIIPRLTVFDAVSFTVKVFPSSPVAPSLSLLMPPQFAAGQYAVPAVSTCAAVVPYTPFVTSGGTLSPTVRFRMFTTAAEDSSHVYTSICDGGTIADVDATTSSIDAGGGNNTPDTLMTDLAAPFSAGPAGSNGEPLPQSPIFLLTGQ